MTTPIIPHKRCIKCGQEFPSTPEFWHRDKSKPDGLVSACKACKREYIRARNAANPERNRERVRKWAQANPERVRERSRAWYYANPERTKANRDQYRQAHYDEFREWQQLWAKNNPERVHQFKRRYKEANREKIREAGRRYSRENKDKLREYRKRYRQANPEKVREAARQAIKKNPESARARVRNRRARLRTAEGTHTAVDIQAQIKRQRGRCFYCGCKLDKYHVDHVQPLSRGGSNDPSNLVIACPFCNDSKGAKLLHEWEGSGGRMF